MPPRDAAGWLVDEAVRAQRMVAGLRSFEVVGDADAEAYWRDKLAEWRSEIEAALEPYPDQLDVFREPLLVPSRDERGWWNEVTSEFQQRLDRLRLIVDQLRI